jgi:galactose-1-phosphate uridylyltransferase
MPLEYEIRDGFLTWVRNPFTGVTSYVVDLRDKSFAFTLGTQGPVTPTAPVLDPATKQQAIAVCPFCPGNEELTCPELMRLPTTALEAGQTGSSWSLRVFNNLFPRIPIEYTGGRNESYILVEDPRHFQDAASRHDDLMYTAALGPEQFVRIVRICAQITQMARENPAVRSVLVRKNQGRESGASQPHVHTQIIGSAELWPSLMTEVRVLKEHPRLFDELANLAFKCDLTFPADAGLAVYLSPIGTFPHSYDIVMPDFFGTLDQLGESQLESFARALHCVLELVGPLPLDYEIHQAQELPLHAHVNARRFPYSNVGGTLQLPRRMLENAALRRQLLR